MALQEQSIEIPFAGKLDEKTNPHLLGQNGLLELQNFVRLKSGELRQRPGWQFADALNGGGENPTNLMVYKNQVFGVGPHYIQKDDDVAVITDHVPEFTMSEFRAMTGSYAGTISEYDIAEKDGQFIVAAVVTRNDGTGEKAIVVSEFAISEFGPAIKTVERELYSTTNLIGHVQAGARDSGFVVTWMEGPEASNLVNVKACTFVEAEGSTSTNTVITDMYADTGVSGFIGRYALHTLADNDDFWIAYHRFNAATHTITLERIGTTEYTANAATVSDDVLCISCHGDDTDVWIAWFGGDEEGDGEVHYAIRDTAAGTEVLAETNVTPSGMIDAARLYCHHISIRIRTGTTAAIVWSEHLDSSDDADSARVMRLTRVNRDGSNGSEVITDQWRAHLVSQLFEEDGVMYCVGLVQDLQADRGTQISNTVTMTGATATAFTQSMYVLFDTRKGSTNFAGSALPRPVAFFGYLEGRMPGQNVTPHFTASASTVHKYATIVPYLQPRPDRSAFIGTSGAYELQAVAFRPSDPALWRGQEIGEVLVAPSAMPVYFDGRTLAEIGFPHHAEITKLVRIVGGGNLSVNFYSYKAVFVREDDTGQVYRSAPSAPVTIQLTDTGDVQITVTHANVTAAQDNENQYRANTKIEIYRTSGTGTAAPGNTYYYVGSIPNDVANEYNSTAFVDNIDNTTLETNAILYTSNQILPYEPPPPARYQTVWKNRVWWASGKSLFYSNEFVREEGITMSRDNEIRIDDDGGPVTGLAPLMDSLVVFKKTKTFRIYGDGPNDLGQGNTLTEALLVNEESGCVAGEHIVRLPNGALLFETLRGWHVMGPDFRMQYIAGPVEDTLAAYPVTTFAIKERETDWVLVGRKNAAGTAGVTLRYDLLFQEWSVDVVGDGTSSDMLIHAVQTVESDGSDPTLWALQGSGDRVKQVYDNGDNNTTAGSANAAFSPRLVTPWYSLGGPNGWFRMRRVYLLLHNATFSNPSAADVTVEMANNFAPDTWKRVALHSLSPSRTDAVTIRLVPPQQQIQSCRFRITLSQSDENGDQSGSLARLSSMRLQFAVPKGAARLSEARSY